MYMYMYYTLMCTVFEFLFQLLLPLLQEERLQSHSLILTFVSGLVLEDN